MRDEYDARIWNDHGHQLSEDLHRLFEAVRFTFCKLSAINFRAPWRGTGASC